LKNCAINTILFLYVSFFALVLSGCDKKNSPSGPSNTEGYAIIGGDSTFSLTLDKSPYRVIKDLIVDSMKTLDIEEGVRIYFEDSTRLLVRGRISCSGSVSQPILFSSKNLSWKGIEITESSLQSVIQFTIIENIDVTMMSDTIRNSAVEIVKANVEIRNSIFRKNRSNNGGALVIDQSQSLITNNIFIDNYAVGFGGAMLSSSSSNKIMNNTFYNNESNNDAGGLLLYSPVLDNIQNNIFFENYCKTGDPRISFMFTDSSHYTVQYNFLEAGNNPYFISNNDLHLSATSPCINTGNPDSQYNDADGTRNDQGAYGGPLGSW
jgi:hypothetical protein